MLPSPYDTSPESVCECVLVCFVCMEGGCDVYAPVYLGERVGRRGREVLES